MSMTDPIADMLTRIRNGTQAGHRRVEIPASNEKRAIARVLVEQGYVARFEEITEGPQGALRLFLKYYDRDGQRTGVGMPLVLKQAMLDGSGEGTAA